METTYYESANQKTHGLKATKARQVGELSGIQTTELSVETPAPLSEGKSLNHNVTVFMYYYSGHPLGPIYYISFLQHKQDTFRCVYIYSIQFVYITPYSFYHAFDEL